MSCEPRFVKPWGLEAFAKILRILADQASGTPTMTFKPIQNENLFFRLVEKYSDSQRCRRTLTEALMRRESDRVVWNI
jgi:hypothetical protein